MTKRNVVVLLMSIYFKVSSSPRSKVEGLHAHIFSFNFISYIQDIAQERLKELPLLTSTETKKDFYRCENGCALHCCRNQHPFLEPLSASFFLLLHLFIIPPWNLPPPHLKSSSSPPVFLCCKSCFELHWFLSCHEYLHSLQLRPKLNNADNPLATENSL